MAMVVAAAAAGVVGKAALESAASGRWCCPGRHPWIWLQIESAATSGGGGWILSTTCSLLQTGGEQQGNYRLLQSCKSKGCTCMYVVCLARKVGGKN